MIARNAADVERDYPSLQNENPRNPNLWQNQIFPPA